jgi:hypothetical protein
VVDELAKAYLEAARESIGRARRLLLITLTVSGLVLMAYWNLLASFSLERLSHYSAASYWLGTHGDTACARQTDDFRKVCEKAVKVMAEVAEEEAIPAAMWNARSDDIAKRVNARLSLLRNETITRHVSLPAPVSGIAIDIADLGFFAGLSIMALLAILALTVNAEIRDVGAALRVGRRAGATHGLYELIMARQVFTIPPSESPMNRALRYSTKTFFAFPLLAQTCGLVVHVYYRFAVPGTSARVSIVDLGVPTVFWLISAAFTYELFQLEAQYRNLLAKEANPVHSAEANDARNST